MAKSQTEVAKDEGTQQQPQASAQQPQPQAEKATDSVRTFILLSGVHYDEEGEHLPDSPTKFVKSTKDLATAEPQRYAPYIPV